MRKILMLGVLVLAGCRGDDVGRLQPGGVATVVPVEKGRGYVVVRLGESVAILEAGARVVVVADREIPEHARRFVTVTARASDLRMADHAGTPEARVSLPRECLLAD